MPQKELKEKIIEILNNYLDEYDDMTYENDIPPNNDVYADQILELFEQDKQKAYSEGFDYANKLRNFAIKKVGGNKELK